MDNLKKNTLFKIIALTVAFTFFYQQILWAVDYQYGLPVNNEENRSGFLSAEELAQAQARQEGFIAYLQNVEESNQSQTAQEDLAVMAETGDILHYSGDTLKYIERPDGSVLDAISTDQANNLTNAAVKYADGSILVIENGKNKSYAKSDGTVIHYNQDGLVEEEILKSGLVLSYTYEKDPSGNVTKTIVTSSKARSEYDANGVLIKVTKSDGTILEYQNGIPIKITTSDNGIYLFNQKAITSADGTNELEVNLKQYTDPAGNIYNYEDASLVSIELSDKTKIINITLDDAGSLKDGTIELSDHSIQKISGGYITQVTKPEQTIIDYQRDSSGTVSKIIVTLPDETVFHYSPTGNLIKSVAANNTVFDYQNGLIVDKIYPDTKIATYIREYDLTTKPLRLTIKGPNAIVSTYLFDELGNLAALGVDTNLPATTPFNKPTTARIIPQNVATDGVIATDGKYLYVKRSAAYSGSDTFVKIGTGFGGTTAGKNYGNLASSTKSYSAVYYPDGYIYNPISSVTNKLEKINVSTGTKTQITIPSGLIERSSGKVKTGYTLITSDGRYIYNVAYHIDNGGTTYNGWTVKIFDPKNNWQVVKTYTVGTSSYATNGVVADGVYLYFIEWKNADTARITMSRISDGAIVKTYSVNQGATKVVNGQYDWVNNKIWLGAASTNGIYSYDGLIQRTGLGSVDTTGFFSPVANATLPAYDINPKVPAMDIPSRSDFDTQVAFKELTYTVDFKLKKSVLYNGTVINFKDGLIDSVIDKDGNLITYTYQSSNLGNLVNIAVAKNGLSLNYELYGNLDQLSNGGIDLSINNNLVSRVEKEDGTLIENAAFDSNNNIISGKITKPDGVVAIYDGGVLRELDSPDGSKFYYDAQGSITRYINQKGTIYDYSLLQDGDQLFTVAQVMDTSAVQDSEEPIYLKYNQDKKITRLIRKNGQVLDYTYNKDSSGNIISVIVSDGKSVSTYDGNNNILTSEILATEDDPELTSEYEYGRIRRVYKGDELIYRYTYEFDASGSEITVIEDVKTGDVKRYKDGLLITVTDPNNLVTSYEYNSDKKISKSTVTRSGKLVSSYTYIYDGDFTTIEDIDGIKRTYDKNNKLTYLEEKGMTYAYTYNIDESGNEAIVQELIKVKDDSGSVTNYKDGNIESIIKPDGTIFKDLIITEGELTGYTMEKGGSLYFVEGGLIIKEIRQDGAVVEYYPNGWTESVTTPDGKIARYSYEVAATKLPALEGIAESVELPGSSTEDALQLGISSDPQTPLLLHMDPLDGSGYNHPVTFNGDARLDATNAKFGSSLALDGSGDYLSLPDSDDWNFGTGNFTIDFWVNLDTLPLNSGKSYPTPVCQWLNNDNFWSIYLLQQSADNYRLYFYAYSGAVQQFSFYNKLSSLTTNTWYHIAIVRNGNNFLMFQNGQQIGTTQTSSNPVPDIDAALVIGYRPLDTLGYLDGYIDELRISKGIARWDNNFTPPAAPNTSDSYTKLLTHFESLDSAKNKPVTFHGDAHFDAANAKFGSSLALDGSGDYLSLPDSDDWNFGTGDFTIDFWVNLDTLPLNSGKSYPTPVCQWKDNDNFWSIYILQQSADNYRLYFYAYSGAVQQFSFYNKLSSLTTNTWYHIAIVRNGNNFLMFQNGQQIGTTQTSSNPVPDIDAALVIGYRPLDTLGYLDGYIDELRISKGIARWDNNFTPPDSEYCNSYNASGAFTSNPIELNATELNTISWNETLPVGTDVTIQTRTGNTLNPADGTWSAWSEVLRDPSGSKITSPAAKYIQYKVNLVTTDPNATPKLLKDVNGNFITINYVKSYVYYVNANTNGTSENIDVIDVANEDALQLGTYHDPNTSLLLHIDPLDSSDSNHPVTFNGDAHFDAANAKFGASSFALDGNGDYLSLPDSDDWDFGTGDFTIDFWAKFNAFSPGTNPLFVDIGGYIKGISIRYYTPLNKLCIEFVNSSYSISWFPSTNAWYHIAVVRTGNNLLTFVDGTQLGSAIDVTGKDVTGTTLGVAIGRGTTGSGQDGNPYYLNGWIDEIRISKGIARWTSNFTPPAAPNTSDSYTKLLTHFEPLDVAKSKTATFNGDAHFDTNNTKFGSSSIALDGNGDYLTIPDSDDWNFDNGDFTMDFWVRFNSLPSNGTYQGIYSQRVDPQNDIWFSLYNNNGTYQWIFEVDKSGNTDFTRNSAGLSTQTWHHIALVRNGDTMYMFQDGTLCGTSGSWSKTVPNLSAPIYIGKVLGNYLNGWIDEFRISKGVARWTSNFTPPDSEYRNPYNASGAFTSNPIELNAAELNTISWNETLPVGTDVTIQTRTGNTLNPADGTWSAWSEVLRDPSGSKITSPAAKYIQYKVNLTTADPAATPQVVLSGDNGITISYIEAGTAEVVYVTVEKDGLKYRYTKNEILVQYPNLKFDLGQIEPAYQEIRDNTLPADSPIKAQTFKANLLTQITLSDSTIIKYFNNKPIAILKPDGSKIDNIVLEKYNTTIYDTYYKVENGLLISYEDTTRDKVIVSFTATNSAGNTYIFKNNMLVQVKLVNGTIINNPAQDQFSTTVFGLLEDAFSPDSLAGDKLYQNSDISLSITKDNKVTYFINGKMASTYYRYETGELELLLDYSYDESGNLILVRLPYARDSIEKEITDARQTIALEKANYLRSLAGQKGLAYSQIQTQVQSIRDQINAERVRLQPMLYQEVTRVSQGCWGAETYTETVEVPEVRNALDQLNEQERLLNEEEAKAYGQLDSEIQAALNNLANDEATSLAEIARQEEAFHNQIIEEESTPVILEYYRAILGRDPDDAETDYWLSKVDYNSKINVNELKNTLQASTERINQEALVAALKNRISAFLSTYINATPEERTILLQSLGLTPQDAVPLDQKEVNGILTFLDKQNIHFGRSAFVSLEYLLKENGITYNFQDLAYKTILVDILVGAINSLSEGKLLELSMYSLSKVASLYGLTLYNTNLNYDDLVAAFRSSGKQIAHLKNNHFVVVTNIDTVNNKITYVELNRGQNGYTWTVSKEDFQESWTGYAITKVAPQDQTKIISTWESQRIKGSCLPFLIPIIMFIAQAVVGVVSLAVGAISAVVGMIGSLIGGIIAGIGQALGIIGGFLGQIGGFLFEAVKFVGVSLLKGAGALGGMLFGGGAVAGTAAGATATGFSLTGLGTAIGNTVVLGALSFGVSKGLTSLGVNPTISNLISSFVTGGVGGIFSGTSFLVGGLQGLAMQGVNELGNALGVPPEISSIVGMATSSLIGAGLNGVEVPMYNSAGEVMKDAAGNIMTYTLTGLDAIGYNFGTVVLPNVASELAYYGVQRLGEIAGIDPRISYLAGVGIRSTINAGLTHEFKPDVIWGSVTQGLLQGVTNIGLNFATEELGISPLLANIGFSAISGAINAGIQAATGGSKNVFGALFKTYTDNALTFLGSGDTSNAWQQAAYISQIQDFTKIVMEKGLVEALNTYGAGFFNAVAVNNIVQSGYTLGGYFAEKLQSGQYMTRILQDGTVVKEVAVTDGQNTLANAFFQQKQVGEDTYWDLIGGEEFIGGDSYLGWGDFGVDAYGKLGYTDAELYSAFGSDIQFQRIEGGLQTYAEIKDLQGNTLLIIEPTEDGYYNMYNSYGEYVDAKIEAYSQPLTISLKDGFAAYSNSPFSSNFLYDGDIERLSEYGFTIEDLYSAQLSLTTSSDGTTSRMLYWSSREQAENVWTKMSQPGIWANVQERFDNASQWLGFRTNAEIQQSLLNEHQKISTMGQTGDIIFVNGRGFLANTTKNITRGPTNHTAMLYVDSNGEKWALEMLAETGLQKIKLTDFMKRMVDEGNDIQIGRRNSVDIEVMNTTIRQELFKPQSEDVKNIPYNSLNLFGLNERSEKSFICSGMIKYIYQKAYRPLFVTDQFQYSPVDIYSEIDKIGTKY